MILHKLLKTHFHSLHYWQSFTIANQDSASKAEIGRKFKNGATINDSFIYTTRMYCGAMMIA